MAKFKVTFTLDEADASYFRSLYRKAKKGAVGQDPAKIIREAKAIVKEVRASKKTPAFVSEAISVLSDLTDLIQDDEYAAPAPVRNQVMAAIAYFANPDDLIPDHIPGLGFLDDAIMIKFIEDEFKHELWGYRRFRAHRDTAEQRPWAAAGKERLRKRLDSDRKKIRGEISKREAKDAQKKKSGSYLGW
jgi:uncharacterized membrane protein YkvA (DUF1232 family)